MKKFFCLFFLFVFVNISGVFAQNGGIKHYSDHSRNFEGYAASSFMCDFNEIKKDIDADGFIQLLKEKFNGLLKPVSKLTKNNTWLMERALNEWDYTKGEFYVVMCVESLNAESAVFVFVTIDEDSSYKWCAFLVDESNMNKLSATINSASDFFTFISGDE